MTVRFLEAVTLAPARRGAGGVDGSGGASVSISPVAAGHSLGAAIWQISVSGGDDVIVYAVHYNLRAERHLPRLAPAQLERRPTLLITDACAMLERGCAPLRAPLLLPSRDGGGGGALDAVDRALLDAVMAPLHVGGSVLLPTDSTGRALELLMRLDLAWQKGFPPLCFLSFVGANTLEFATGMLEYMSDCLTRSFVDDRAAPFKLVHARVVSSLQDVEALMSEGGGGRRSPVAVICAFGSLDAGAARTLFLTRLASDPAAAVIFTDRLLAGGSGAGDAVDSGDGPSLAEALLTTTLPASVVVVETERVPLQGAELAAWADAAEARRLRAARAAAAARLAKQERRDSIQAAPPPPPPPPPLQSPRAVAPPASTFTAASMAAPMPPPPPTPAAALEFVDEEGEGGVGADELALEQASAPLHQRGCGAAAMMICPLCTLGGRPSTTGDGARRFPVFRSMAEDDSADSGGPATPAQVSTAAAAVAEAPSVAMQAGAVAPATAACATADESAAASIVLLSASTASGPSGSAVAPILRRSAFLLGPNAAAAAARSARVRDAISERLGRLLPGYDEAIGVVAAASPPPPLQLPPPPAAAADPDLSADAGAPPPSKLQRMQAWVYVACRVSMLDISGRCDADAATNLIEEVAPQSVVVLPGGAAAAAVHALVDALSPRVACALPALFASARLAVPARDAVVKSYIRHALYSRLGFARLAGCSTVFLAGTFEERADTTGAAAAPLERPPQMLLLAPDPNALAAHYHAPVAVSAGATRVSALLRHLSRAGMRARIVEGGLVAAGGTVVRRPPSAAGSAAPATELLLEGPLSAEFFAARAAVQGSFTVL